MTKVLKIDFPTKKGKAQDIKLIIRAGRNNEVVRCTITVEGRIVVHQAETVFINAEKVKTIEKISPAKNDDFYYNIIFTEV